MKIKFLNTFLVLVGLFIFLVVVETQLSFSDTSRHCENNVRKFIKDIDEAYKTQNIEALEKLAYLARACYKDGELQSEIKTKIKIFKDNNKTTFPNQNINTKDNISIFPKSEQDKISVGGISTNNPFNQPYIGGVQGQEQNFKDNVIYAENDTTMYNWHLVGTNGTQTNSSHTLLNLNSNERIDVENILPGKRVGQIHYQNKKISDKKYVYDLSNNKFVDIETGEDAPKKIQNLLDNEKVQKAIKQGIKILGE